jgi:rare lipoprotein A
MIMTRIRAPFVLAICAAFLLSACAETQFVMHGAKELTGSANSSKVAKTKGRYKVGNPYQIKETWYYPAENFKYAETGIASWYGPQFHGKRTANGETFDMNSLTAAHRTLPMPSAVRVVNLTNGRSIILRVNDRGPFARSRIIDLSRRAAQLLGFQRQGTARVRVEIVADESRQLKLSAMNGKLTQSERITGQAVAKQSVQSRPLAVNRTASVERFDGDAGRDVLRRSPVTDNRPVVKTVAPTVESKLFVQAGAYADFANASRVRTRLSRFGPAWVTKAQVGRRNFYRVRVGPLQTVENADAVLARLMTSGFPKARIVLD